MSRMRSGGYFRSSLTSQVVEESKASHDGTRTPDSRTMSSLEEGTPDERPRSALRIRLEILEAVKEEGPSRSTRISRRTKLSHVRFVRYLEELVSLGLLEEDRNGLEKLYTVTARGLDFVSRVRETAALVASFGFTI
ncbi:MAG: winged helix DNA-binding protein [Thaumarchaeota archaeon]|nr:winged helix DNA-binding protein [Nitrososphaerota archaeon]